MPLWVFPTVYAIAIVVTLAAGIWLLLHLAAVARTFAGKVDIVPSPKPAHVSRRAVRIALAVFAAGLGVTMGIQLLALTGVVNA
jgi:hypothetical protein